MSMCSLKATIKVKISTIAQHMLRRQYLFLTITVKRKVLTDILR